MDGRQGGKEILGEHKNNYKMETAYEIRRSHPTIVCTFMKDNSIILWDDKCKLNEFGHSEISDTCFRYMQQEKSNL